MLTDTLAVDAQLRLPVALVSTERGNVVSLCPESKSRTLNERCLPAGRRPTLLTTVPVSFEAVPTHTVPRGQTDGILVADGRVGDTRDRRETGDSVSQIP